MGKQGQIVGDGLFWNSYTDISTSANLPVAHDKQNPTKQLYDLTVNATETVL